MEIGLVPEIVVYNLEKWKTSGIKICRIKMSGIEYKCGIDFRNVFDKWLWVYCEYILTIHNVKQHQVAKDAGGISGWNEMKCNENNEWTNSLCNCIWTWVNKNGAEQIY